MSEGGREGEGEEGREREKKGARVGEREGECKKEMEGSIINNIIDLNKHVPRYTYCIILV